MKKKYLFSFILGFVFLILSVDVFSIRSNFLSNLKEERTLLQGISQAKILSHLIPDFKPLIYHNYDKNSRLPIGLYTSYYEKVLEIYPDFPTVHTFLGYLYYYQGEEGLALKDFEEEVIANPDFFWAYYNMGVICFNQGQYQRAIKMFSQAQKTDFEKTLSMLYESKLYSDILAKPGSQKIFYENLERAQIRSYLLIGLSLQRLGEINKSQRILSRLSSRDLKVLEKKFFELHLF